MTSGPFKALQDILKINPKVGAFVAGGYIALAVAIVLLGQMGESATGISPLLLAVYLLGFSLVVLILTQLPAVLRTLLAWVMVVLFGLWMIAVFAQLVTGGHAPGIAPLSCLVNPLGQACEADEVRSAGLGEPSGSGEQADAGVAPRPEAGPTTPEADRSGTRVQVFFAGSMGRDEIDEIGQELASEGWNVLSAGGGLRHEKAYRRMEVLYFHDEDLALAESLASAFSALLPDDQPLEAKRASAVEPIGDEGTESLDADRAEQSVAPGYLEVWINPKMP